MFDPISLGLGYAAWKLDVGREGAITLFQRSENVCTNNYHPYE